MRKTAVNGSTTSVEPKQRRFARVEKKKARNFFFLLSISDTIKVSPFLLSSDSLVFLLTISLPFRLFFFSFVFWDEVSGRELW